MTKSLFRGAAVALAMLTCAPVQSAPVAIRQGEVAALHGGVGEEARAAMQAKAAEYNLRLTFAAKGSGAYLSEVKVTIRNAGGQTVLDTVASGPWLFARLPQGRYQVAASAFGQTLTQQLSVPQAGHRAWVFRFDAPAAPRTEPR